MKPIEAPIETNFDGLVGPTHHYAGLAYGNLASAAHAQQPSNPRAAALQGLQKMRLLHGLGIPQAVLPPQERPHLPTLRALGFDGSDAEVLARAAREAPALLSACSAASAMWTANAATVSGSAETADHRVHFTPANLCTQLHRAIETATTARVLRRVFASADHFVHHPPLPATPAFGDEGAANVMHLRGENDTDALTIFVHGRDGDERDTGSSRFPARQTRLASAAIARQHGLRADRVLHLRQHAAAIDAGVFHNDVIAVAHAQVLLLHEQAYGDSEALATRLSDAGYRVLRISSAELPLADAVQSYLFNSQLVTRSDGAMQLIVAAECREQPRVWALIEGLIADPRNPIAAVSVVDLRQSMHNGGGPACLRLRVPLTPREAAAVLPGVFCDAARFDALEAWVRKHYREHLLPNDLADPQLLDESRRALDVLSTLLGLGSVYDFQQA